MRVTRAWAAVDVGQVINPDGVVNQIEGGIVQAISWTLKERVAYDSHGVTSRNWDDYPILTFAEVPEVEVALIDRPELPPLGAGEGMPGPTAAAIGNAIYNAMKVRLRDMPFTRERLIAAHACADEDGSATGDAVRSTAAGRTEPSERVNAAEEASTSSSRIAASRARVASVFAHDHSSSSITGFQLADSSSSS